MWMKSEYMFNYMVIFLVIWSFVFCNQLALGLQFDSHT